MTTERDYYVKLTGWEIRKLIDKLEPESLRGGVKEPNEKALADKLKGALNE